MNIIVTGAGKGIGYELVKFLSTSSDNTIFAVSRNQVNLEKLKKECFELNSSSKINILSFDLCDLINEEGLFIDKIIKYAAHIDILVNNAGYLHNEPFDTIDKDEIKKMMDINFLAPAFLIRELSPVLGKNGTSHIVNIGSMGGIQGSSKYKGLSVYSAAKSALAVLTECLSVEYKDRNVYFNCLSLGAVETEMFREAFPECKAPVSASEIVPFIADFALNGYKYFRGKILPVSISNP